MNIFISWSKDRSKQVAEILSWWLPNVIQHLKPWFSNNDLEKGKRWLDAISKQLEISEIGIVCLTPENLTEPWIMFETGALAKTMDRHYICPVLLDLKNTDLNQPFSDFQTTTLNKDDVFKLLVTINKALEGNQLKESRLKETFRVWWPRLNNKLKRISKTPGKKFERADRDILEEILNRVRYMQNGAIGYLLATLSPREEKIVRMRYGIGESGEYTIEQISRILGLPSAQIEQILIRTIKKLAKPEIVEWLLKNSQVGWAQPTSSKAL